MNRMLSELPEAFVSNTSISGAVSRAVRAGELRRLASRLYTRNLDDPPEEVVRRNLWGIVAGYFPGALVADRTALEAAPAPDGSVFLVSERGRIIDLPGIVLRPRRGAGPAESDMPFVAGLRLSSMARAYLENVRPSRARGGRVARTLTRGELEERLDSLIRASGEAGVNQLRDDARALGNELGMAPEFAKLDALIGTLLGTRDSRLDSSLARARSRGRPYDPDRMELFHRLHQALRNHPPSFRPSPPRDSGARSTLAFFEAYFSNFVEGTEFLVDEAVRIVFEGEIPQHRPADAHDVVGTWQIVSDLQEMSRTPRDFAGLAHILRERHREIMAGRPEMRPGGFKVTPNRAGQTLFVAPDLIRGTWNRDLRCIGALNRRSLGPST